MICIAGPYALNDADREMYRRITADMQRPDKRGERIQWAAKQGDYGTEIWRVPPPDLIDTRSQIGRFRLT